MKVDHWKKALHRCPHCPAVGIVVGSDDRPGEWNILWAFPGPRDIIGGPSEVARDGSVNDYTLSRPDFGCGYCQETLRPGNLADYLKRVSANELETEAYREAYLDELAIASSRLERLEHAAKAVLEAGCHSMERDLGVALGGLAAALDSPGKTPDGYVSPAEEWEALRAVATAAQAVVADGMSFRSAAHIERLAEAIRRLPVGSTQLPG